MNPRSQIVISKIITVIANMRVARQSDELREAFSVGKAFICMLRQTNSAADIRMYQQRCSYKYFNNVSESVRSA